MAKLLSAETANKLKEHGFPQPSPENWQFWYSPNGAAFTITHVADSWLWAIDEGESEVREMAHSDLQYCCFIPDVEDLMKAMPNGKKRLYYSSHIGEFDFNEVSFEKSAVESAANYWKYRRINGD